MKKTKLAIALAMIVCLIAIPLSLASCFGGADDGTTKVEVESIQIADTDVYMAPTGVTSTFTLQPTVLPANATNKKVTYQFVTTNGNRFCDLTQDGKITAKAKLEDENPIVIRIFSQSNRNVYVDVNVYIQEVAVEGLSFAQSQIDIILTADEPTKLEPVLTPTNATIGGNGKLIYTSDNPTVCDVNEDGTLVPKKVGQVSIRVATPAASYEEPIQTWITVRVKYEPLAYNLEKVSSDDKFKQIYGDAEQIELSLVCYNNNCDQEPNIIWYCDGQEGDALQSYRNNMTLSFTPNSVPVGTHKLYAELTDVSGDVLKTEEYTLNIYSALLGVDLELNGRVAGSYSEGDMISVTVSQVDGQYPPEQFNWYLKGKGLGGTDKLIKETSVPSLSYQLADSGDLTLICEPVIKGTAKVTLRQEISLGSVGKRAVDGCDVYGLYVEGNKLGSDYLPFVYWDAVAYDTDYEVQIILNGEESVTTMSSTDNQYSDYFYRYGCFIPDTIAKLTDKFSVRVKTGEYNYSSWVIYNADIDSTKYSYLEDVIPGTGLNGYISNLEEFGKLLNYISIMRPQNLYYSASSNPVIANQEGYGFKVYTTLDYMDMDQNLYPMLSGSTALGEGETEQMRNIRCLFSAAVNCYCDSSSYSIVRTVDEGGNANIVLSYKQDVVFDYEQTDVYIDTETYDSQSYASGAFKRQNGALLPIDYIQETMSVRTSNQLYLALSMGYRPVPVAGSSAETVYNAMKAVLIRISSDSFTDAQKVHAIYDYLSTEVCYDYDILDIIDYYDKNPNPLFNSNVYECFYLEGVFLRGRAVCDGIAKAFNSLCWMEGVTAKKISGEETRSNVGHAWNKVFVDGSWYGVDSTWGSTRAGTTEEWQNHKYMMTTDAILNVQHNTYGMSPATSTTAYMGYYESTNWEGADVEDIDHVIKSVDEAKDFTDDYATPALDSVGDFIYVEIYLDGITYNDFYQTFVNNFAYSVGVSKIDLGDNYVLIIMTRRPDQVQ